MLFAPCAAFQQIFSTFLNTFRHNLHSSNFHVSFLFFLFTCTDIFQFALFFSVYNAQFQYFCHFVIHSVDGKQELPINHYSLIQFSCTYLLFSSILKSLTATFNWTLCALLFIVSSNIIFNCGYLDVHIVLRNGAIYRVYRVSPNLCTAWLVMNSAFLCVSCNSRV